MAAKSKWYLAPGVSGAVAKTIVIKQYTGKTVITAYPDMHGITPSKKQKTQRSAFAKAVAYARSINNDPLKKAEYRAKTEKGRSVYHAALADYLFRLHQWEEEVPGSPLVRSSFVFL